MVGGREMVILAVFVEASIVEVAIVDNYFSFRRWLESRG